METISEIKANKAADRRQEPFENLERAMNDANKLDDKGRTEDKNQQIAEGASGNPIRNNQGLQNNFETQKIEASSKQEQAALNRQSAYEQFTIDIAKLRAGGNDEGLPA